MVNNIWKSFIEFIPEGTAGKDSPEVPLERKITNLFLLRNYFDDA